MSQANDFFDDYGGVGPPTILWSDSRAAWSHYEVRGHPYALLLDPAGATTIERTSGFDPGLFEDRLAELA